MASPQQGRRGFQAGAASDGLPASHILISLEECPAAVYSLARQNALLRIEPQVRVSLFFGADAQIGHGPRLFRS